MLRQAVKSIPGFEFAARPLLGLLNHPMLREQGAYGAWSAYDTLVSLLKRGKLAASFCDDGYHKGRISEALVSRWREACGRARQVPYTVGEASSDYVAAISTDMVALLRDHFSWYDPRSIDPALMLDTLRALEPEVKTCLGCDFKVVNFKIVRSLAGAPDVGMYDWHLDHFPLNFHKLLIYISGATAASGSTEIRREDGSVFAISGPPGTWVLFNASKLTHRGRPVTEGERLLLELTVTRALRSRPRIGYGGVNSCYPRYPWVGTDVLGMEKSPAGTSSNR